MGMWTSCRAVPAAWRPLSSPLMQRVGRQVPCRGWSEDVRGEPGCRGNAVSSPELGGSASPGAYPIPLTRCDLHEALVSVRPYMALRSTVTVVLFLRTLLSARQGLSSCPSAQERESAVQTYCPGKSLGGTVPTPHTRVFAASSAEEMDFVKKRGKETWLK